jgi:H+-transporting ATPase
MGIIDLLFCLACFSTGRYLLGLDTATLQTLTVVTLVFSGQSVLYVARERRHIWNSRPGKLLMASSVVDVGIITALAAAGILMHPLPIAIITGLFVAAAVFAFLLDSVKLMLFRRLKIA